MVTALRTYRQRDALFTARTARRRCDNALRRRPVLSEVGGRPDKGRLFSINDLDVFDDATLREIATCDVYGVSVADLAACIEAASPRLRQRILAAIPLHKKPIVWAQQAIARLRGGRKAAAQARRRVLHALFWELTYWKTPHLYEELVAGEEIHPGIFAQLDLDHKTVLDAGAGSGRATLLCAERADKVIALEPSPGLLRILTDKITGRYNNVQVARGRFNAIPLSDGAVDVALACSAFTSDAAMGGDNGLRELERVTRKGGQIIIIWPRACDRQWLEERGFRYVALPTEGEMRIQFRSLGEALRLARRFYGRKAVAYLRKYGRPELPFSVIGYNQPNDYMIKTV